MNKKHSEHEETGTSLLTGSTWMLASPIGNKFSSLGVIEANEYFKFLFHRAVYKFAENKF